MWCYCSSSSGRRRSVYPKGLSYRRTSPKERFFSTTSTRKGIRGYSQLTIVSPHCSRLFCVLFYEYYATTMCCRGNKNATRTFITNHGSNDEVRRRRIVGNHARAVGLPRRRMEYWDGNGGLAYPRIGYVSDAGFKSVSDQCHAGSSAVHVLTVCLREKNSGPQRSESGPMLGGKWLVHVVGLRFLLRNILDWSNIGVLMTAYMIRFTSYIDVGKLPPLGTTELVDPEMTYTNLQGVAGIVDV